VGGNRAENPEYVKFIRGRSIRPASTLRSVSKEIRRSANEFRMMLRGSGSIADIFKRSSNAEIDLLIRASRQTKLRDNEKYLCKLNNFSKERGRGLRFDATWNRPFLCFYDTSPRNDRRVAVRNYEFLFFSRCWAATMVRASPSKSHCAPV